MLPIDFDGSNITFKKPAGNDDVNDIRAAIGTDINNMPFILTVWQPSKEDIEAITSGQPVYVKVVGTRFVPMSLFTISEAGDPNY